MTLHVFAPSGDAGDFCKNHCLHACIGYQVVTDMDELKSLVESGQARYIGSETVDMLIPVLPVDGVEYLIAREGIDTRNNPAVRTALVAGLAAGATCGLKAVMQALHTAPGGTTIGPVSSAATEGLVVGFNFTPAKDIVAEQQEAEAEQEPSTLSDAESPSASPLGDLMVGAPVVVTPEVIPGDGQTEEPAAVSADPAAEQPDPAGDSPAGDTSEEPTSTVSDEERQKIIAAHYAEFGRGTCATLADKLGISVQKARGALASYEKAQ